MPKIVPIVEGPGEVEAVPSLLWKLLREMGRYDVQVARPKNAHGCGNLTTPGGLEKFVTLAGLERDCGAVLILMDADEQCPVQLAQSFAGRVQTMGVKHPVVVVIARCEYEAWFLASLPTIAATLGLPDGTEYAGDVEARTGVKGWLSGQLPAGQAYKETIDQATMTSLLDTSLARQRSRSFRRLCHAIEQALEAVDNGQVVVTPSHQDT